MDHSNNDCILVVILTHGDGRKLCSKDSSYSLETLTNYFTGDRCPSLAEKPKLFVIQACQGDRSDGGATMTHTIETDSFETRSYSIPIHANFLIAYSTIDGE